MWLFIFRNLDRADGCDLEGYGLFHYCVCYACANAVGLSTYLSYLLYTVQQCSTACTRAALHYLTQTYANLDT